MEIILLILSIMMGGPGNPPVEDDLRTSLTWDVAYSLTRGMPDASPVFEGHKRKVYIGISFPDSITSCTLGVTYNRKSGEYSPLRWEC